MATPLKTRLRTGSALTLYALALYLVSRTVAVIAFLEVQYFPDSIRYRDASTAFEITDPVSQEAYLVQLFWSGPEVVGLALQVALSSFAWTYALYTFLRYARGKFFTVAGFAAIGLVSLSNIVIGWDVALLTESMGVSGSLLALVGGINICFSRSHKARHMSILISGLLILSLARPVALFLVLPFVVVAGLSPSMTPRNRAAYFPLVVAATAVGALTLAQTQGTASETFRAENRLALRANPTLLAAAESDGLKFCENLTDEELVQRATNATRQTSFLGLPQRDYVGENYLSALELVRNTECEPVSLWLAAGRFSLIKQLQYSPRETTQLYLQMLRMQFEPPSYFGAGESLQKYKRYEKQTILLTYLLLSAYFLIKVARMLSTQARNSRMQFAVYLYLTFTLSLFGYSLLTWLADGMEIPRHFLPASIVMVPILLELISVLRSDPPRVLRSDPPRRE